MMSDSHMSVNSWNPNACEYIKFTYMKTKNERLIKKKKCKFEKCTHLLSSGTSYPLSIYSIPAGTAIVRSNLGRPVFDDSLLKSSRNSFIFQC